MTYESKLPDQPSALIRVALADLQKCIADPIYKIDMKTWHKPVDSGKHCSVCLAGSVLAQTLNVPPNESVPTQSPFAWRFFSDNKKLLALNYFRIGAFFEGLILMGAPHPYNNAALDDVKHLPVVEYDKAHPELFFTAMDNAADALERCGH